MRTRIAVLVVLLLGVCIWCGSSCIAAEQPLGAPDNQSAVTPGDGVVTNLDCTLSNLVVLVEGSSLTTSQKTALIRGLELLHTYAVLIRCHAAQHVVTSLAKRMQKSVRLGRMDDSVYGKLVICINQFIGSCPD